MRFVFLVAFSTVVDKNSLELGIQIYDYKVLYGGIRASEPFEIHCNVYLCYLSLLSLSFKSLVKVNERIMFMIATCFNVLREICKKNCLPVLLTHRPSRPW